MPTAFTILFGIIAFLVLLSWIPGVASKQAGIIDIFWAPIKSFVDPSRAEIIVFILILGGFINVVMHSKALEALIGKLLIKLKNKELFLIPPLMLFFAICGSTYGMAEESLGFYALIVPAMVAVGFDAFTGLMIVLVGCGSGVLASTINPFSIGAAINAAKLGDDFGVTNGLAWRAVSFVIIVSLSIAFVLWYALRVKKDFKKSVVFDQKEEHLNHFSSKSEEIPKLTKKRIITLVVFALTFLLMIFYLISWNNGFNIIAFKDFGELVNEKAWFITKFIPGFGEGYLVEVATIFLISTLIIGIINWNGEKDFVNKVMVGTADMLSVCLVIAVAGGVSVILTETEMQQTIVNGLKIVVDELPKWLIPIILYILFIPLAFLIPSTSGFAAAVFGVLGETLGSDGASGAITAFSFASGIVNLITPTSGVVMGAIALSKIEFKSLIKGLAPLLGVIFLASILLLGIGSVMPGKIF
ncbi:MAG: YfcC family protein [Mycoplasma sp.]|nr:YfcC family protein [Mycoplasma sp.]